MVKYYIGEEKKVVQEEKYFESSIFHEQYKQAIRQIGYIIENPQSDIPNLIAFCGDRGEGKTSCMMSVSYIMEHADKEDVANYLRSVSGYEFGNKRLEMLPVIDPAFFDKHHNILELLLGQLYGTYKEWQNKNRDKLEWNFSGMSKVTKLFQKVKFCLRHVISDSVDEFDPLEELEQLSAGIDLRKNMSDLIAEYLKILEKDFLVIRIDDIDLNMSQAYQMCEELRKYLVSDRCIVMISVKIEQLLTAIENAIHTEASYPQNIDFSAMASKYVDKLIPLACRINMPKVYSLCDQELKVYKNRQNSDVVFESRSVKDGVVRKIFYNTRFLFYNSKGAVSPIIPNNLRSLTHLLGLLFSMEEPEHTDTFNENKNTFKSYFYYSWTKQLGENYKKYALELVNIEDTGKVNKFVINSLQGLYEKNEDALFNDIFNKSNYNYNISIGDVLYVITNLDQQIVEEKTKLYLFFIKSYYSIKLYENYDIITSGEKYIYPKENTDGQLLQYDVWFERVNALQKLVAGAYFSYKPGDIIAPEGNYREYRDYKVISGESYVFTNMIIELDKLKEHYQDLDDENKKKFEKAFNLAEYFMLSVSRSIYSRDRNAFEKSIRNESVPSYLTRYNSKTGYYVFDVLGIFNSIINIEYAYDRFDNICSKSSRNVEQRISLFEFAKQHEFSLLRKMIDVVKNKNEKDKIIEGYNTAEYSITTENGFFFWHHRLLSNATIRNTEVAIAVFEAIKNCRYTVRGSGESNELISEFYSNIKKTNMATYQKGEQDSPYSLEFTFLEPIINLLNDTNITSSLSVTFNDKEYNLPNFKTLFSYRDTALVFSEEGQKKVKEIERLFEVATKKMTPSKVQTIKNRIRNKDYELYNAIPESKWNEILSEKEKYSKKELFKAVLKNYDDFAGVITNRQNLSEQPEATGTSQEIEVPTNDTDRQ